MASLGERILLQDIKKAGLPNVQVEYIFHESRKWRFDFAWPEYMIAVEVEGGVYSQGRHTRGKGFSEDCVKYNAATLDGWSVLRFTTAQVAEKTTIVTIRAMIDRKQR